MSNYLIRKIFRMRKNAVKGKILRRLKRICGLREEEVEGLWEETSQEPKNKQEPKGWGRDRSPPSPQEKFLWPHTILHLWPPQIPKAKHLRGWGFREVIRVVWGSWHQSRTRLVKGHPHSVWLAATRTSWKRVHRSREHTHRAAPGPALRDTGLHCTQHLTGKKTASQKHEDSNFKALSGITNRQWNLELIWMDLISPGCNNHAIVRGQSCSQTACQLPFSAVSQQQQTHCGGTFSGSSSLCPYYALFISNELVRSVRHQLRDASLVSPVSLSCLCPHLGSTSSQ